MLSHTNCRSVQFSLSVMFNSLRTHGLQHTSLPYPSPTPRACSNSRPWSWWCHPTISSSVISFSSCLQSFPASGSFPISQFFTSCDQSIGASASVLAMNIQGWFPCRPRNSQESYPTPQFKNISSSELSLLYGPTLTSVYNYWKSHRFDYRGLCWQSDVTAF